jgi:hypothetical protein
LIWRCAAVQGWSTKPTTRPPTFLGPARGPALDSARRSPHDDHPRGNRYGPTNGLISLLPEIKSLSLLGSLLFWANPPANRGSFGAVVGMRSSLFVECVSELGERVLCVRLDYPACESFHLLDSRPERPVLLHLSLWKALRHQPARLTSRPPPFSSHDPKSASPLHYFIIIHTTYFFLSLLLPSSFVVHLL